MAFILGIHLPARIVIDKEQWPDLISHADLHHEGGADWGGRLGELRQIELPPLSQPPSAGNRDALSRFHVTRSAGLSPCAVDDVEVGAKQISHLIVLVGVDCFLERDQVGIDGAETRKEDLATTLPLAASSPEIHGKDAHARLSDVSLLTV